MRESEGGKKMKIGLETHEAFWLRPKTLEKKGGLRIK